jgi:DNA-binding NtrC family response regulator
MRNPLDNAVMQMQEGGVNYADAMRAFERLFIVRTLERNRGNQTKAAFEMGMHRNTLRRKIEELEIDAKPWLLHRASDAHEGDMNRESGGAA